MFNESNTIEKRYVFCGSVKNRSEAGYFSFYLPYFLILFLNGALRHFLSHLGIFQVVKNGASSCFKSVHGFLNMHTVFCFCLIQTASSLCALVTLLVPPHSAVIPVLQHGLACPMGDALLAV